MIPERNQKYNFNNQRQNKKYNYNTYVQLEYEMNDDVTLFVNFKHNFHKENETFSPKKLKRFKEKSLKMEPFLSELPYHIYD